MRETLRGVRVLALLAAAVCGAALGGAPPAAASNHELAPTPPMGWNTWYSFGQAIDENLVKRQADALVASGMQRAGYDDVVVDGGWKTRDRDADGNVQADPEKFPGGIAALADYVHARGLKLGLHHPVGMTDCAGNSPGTQSAPDATFIEKARRDVALFARWKVDFLKFDLCAFEYPAGATTEEQRAITIDAYRAMATAIEGTGRDIVYSISEYGRYEPWLWAPEIAQMWRTTLDIRPFYGSVLSHIDQQAGLAQYAGPGGFNDPDLLQVGVTTRLDNALPVFDGVPGLTRDEARTNFSMWAMLAAPLMASNDLTRMPPDTLDILTNRRVIAVDQDALGAQATKVRDYSSPAAPGGSDGGDGEPAPATFRDAWDLRNRDGAQQVAGEGAGTPAVLGRSDAQEAADPTWQFSPVADASGEVPTVLSLDGDDDLVTLPGVDDLDLSDGFAFETWVLQRKRTPFGRLFERAPGMQVFVNDAGELQANIRAADGTTVHAQSLETIPLNAWTHVGLRYDVADSGGRLRYFINGEEVAYKVGDVLTTTTQLAGRGNRAYAGNRGQGDRPFDGLLAYARMTVPDDALGDWRTDLFPFEIPERGDLEVWTKPLVGGDRAVALLNRSQEPQTIATTADEVGLRDARRYRIHDLWGPSGHRVTDGDIGAQVPGHGVALYRVHAEGPPPR